MFPTDWFINLYIYSIYKTQLYFFSEWYLNISEYQFINKTKKNSNAMKCSQSSHLRECRGDELSIMILHLLGVGS